jgi:hypothetical protein
MNSIELPAAVRATAAALAVFMTFAMLNGVIAIAEPEQSQWMAQHAPRQATPVASSPHGVIVVAQAQ